MRAAMAMAGLAALAACAPALDWREARPEGSGLQLLLPCRPDRHERSVPLAGSRVTLAMTVCTAENATWAVSHADLADPARVGPALDELRGAAARNMAATVEQALPLAVPGATPNEHSSRVAMQGRRFDGAPLRAQTAVFARGTLVFQATVLGNQLPAEGVETFFGSLRFAP